MKQFLIFNISLYQRLKKLLGFASVCRFSPSCSEYAKQALRRHGMIRGSWLGFCRILKCHPWNKGGHDPVTTI